MRMSEDEIAEALHQTLMSVNEHDRNGEAANIVDGLFFIGRAIYVLAEAVTKAATPSA